MLAKIDPNEQNLFILDYDDNQYNITISNHNWGDEELPDLQITSKSLANLFHHQALNLMTKICNQAQYWKELINNRPYNEFFS